MYMLIDTFFSNTHSKIHDTAHRGSCVPGGLCCFGGCVPRVREGPLLQKPGPHEEHRLPDVREEGGGGEGEGQARRDLVRGHEAAGEVGQGEDPVPHVRQRHRGRDGRRHPGAQKVGLPSAPVRRGRQRRPAEVVKVGHVVAGCPNEVNPNQNSVQKKENWN